MQTADQTRSKRRFSYGTYYVLRGPAGAVTHMQPHDPAGTPGPLAIHRPPRDEHEAAGRCDVLPGGKCVADDGWNTGVEAGHILAEQGEEALWAELGRWYESRFGKDAGQ